jgi:hypothetical protein
MTTATWDELEKTESRRSGVKHTALGLSANGISEGEVHPSLGAYSQELRGLEVLSRTKAQANSWMGKLWSEAIASGRSSAVDRLPELVIAELESNSHQFSTVEFQFLVDKTSATPLEARSAIRLLASIAEEGALPVPKLAPYLRGFLRDPDPAVRLSAAEAIWQVLDRSSLAAVKESIARESNQTVRTTLVHVAAVIA